MANENKNEAARKALDEEKAQFGFNRSGGAPKESGSMDEDDDEDLQDLDDDSNDDEEDEDLDESDEEDEADDSEDDEDSDEEDEEDEEEDDHKKIPVSQFNKLRAEKRDLQKKLDLAIDNNKKLEAMLPDDFSDRVKALATEIGVEDPENFEKVLKLMRDSIVGKDVKNLEEKLSKLEKQVESNKPEATVVDEFPAEWESFEKDILPREFPNATREEIKDLRALMRSLANDPKTGGKVYKHQATGKDVIDPYPLKYILFDNREKFDELVTNKRSEGMENGKSQGISKDAKDGDIKHVNHNSSASDIVSLDKKYAKLDAGRTTLRSPENSTI